jgi:hypothetical protein
MSEIEYEYELIPPEGAPPFAAFSRLDAFDSAFRKLLPEAEFRLEESVSDIPVGEGDLPVIEKVRLIVATTVSREVGRRALERLVGELGRPDVSVANS